MRKLHKFPHQKFGVLGIIIVTLPSVKLWTNQFGNLLRTKSRHKSKEQEQKSTDYKKQKQEALSNNYL